MQRPQLTLEQHRLELHRSTYTQAFPNKYSRLALRSTDEEPTDTKGQLYCTSLYQGLAHPRTLVSRGGSWTQFPAGTKGRLCPTCVVTHSCKSVFYKVFSIHFQYFFLIITQQYMLFQINSTKTPFKISPQFPYRETCHFACASRTE